MEKEQNVPLSNFLYHITELDGHTVLMPYNMREENLLKSNGMAILQSMRYW